VVGSQHIDGALVESRSLRPSDPGDLNRDPFEPPEAAGRLGQAIQAQSSTGLGSRVEWLD
jgi:hypothetical protein